ncbi:hypothetical protein AB205_0102850, partial [Aquarana catesbeiana]
MLSQEEAEAQISELDLLSSMFPSEEEFVVTDQLALAELREFAEKQTEVPPTFTIQFTLTVKLGDGNADNIQGDLVLQKCSATTWLAFPVTSVDAFGNRYRLPNVTRRVKFTAAASILDSAISPALVRSQQTQLHTDLNTYLKNNCIGDVCILSAVDWVKDNASTYLNIVSPTDQQKEIVMTPEDSIFTRLWIYSHHIYNKQKRKYIMEWSEELGLSGFSMPGKPGVVCVEGPQESCEEFWS